MKNFTSSIIFIFLMVSASMAGEIVREVSFHRSEISFSRHKGYDYIKLKGCSNTNIVGEPKLPVKYLSVLIPAGATIAKVEVLGADTEQIPGQYYIFPVQPAFPLSSVKNWSSIYSGKLLSLGRNQVEFAKPKSSVYAMKTPYPSDILGEYSTGNMRGFKIANIALYPIRYIPANKKIVFHSRITVRIYYEETKEPIKGVTDNEMNLLKKRISCIVENKGDIEMYKPPIIETGSYGGKSLPAGTYEYVIITGPDSAGIAMDTIFQRLADWKTRKGVPSKVINVDWIYANYIGSDNQEKIRNFIKDANDTWGTMYFLLGGQCDYEYFPNQEIVPRRDAYYKNVDGDKRDTIPCDLYFSDIYGDYYVFNRDWDYDNDGIYGEIADRVDMYTDVYVGRAPVNSISQAQRFVSKVLTYEKNPPLGYNQNMLLPAVELFTYYNYWGDTVNNFIADITPVDWNDNKLYESDGSLSRAAVIASINNGVGSTHFATHGNNWGVYYANGDVVMDIGDVWGLTNGDKLGVFTSIGCWNGAIDFCESPSDCFAEQLVNYSQNGAVATIMNTRYGWGSIPGMGTSEIIDTTFYHAVFNDSIYHLGQALAAAKDPWVGAAIAEGWDGYFRWCIYELWLFGDPEMPMWTATPESLLVTHPNTIPIGSTEYFTVNVKDKRTGVSIENALVCVMFDDMSLYQRGYTDASGNITFVVSPPAVDTMRITATYINHLPYEGNANVVLSDLVGYYKHTIDDDNLGTSSGNGDGIINPGESIEIPLWVRNWGTLGVSNITGKLRTTDSYVTITDSVELFGNIAAGDSVLTPDDYDFTVAPACTNGHEIVFDLVCDDGTKSTWISHPTVSVGTPVFAFVSDTVDDAGQIIPNGYLDPGETVNMLIYIRNKGLGNATGVGAKLITDDIYTTIGDSLADYGSIGTMQTGSNESNPFVVSADPVTPVDHKAIFELIITCAEGFTDTIEFSMVIGQVASYYPQGPDEYGYYAYDNTDMRYTECPTYSWIDISDIGTAITDANYGWYFDPVRLDLPFTFKYYGIDYNRITICKNGWIGLGDQYDLWGNDEPLQWYFCKPITIELGHEEGPSSMVAVAWAWHNLVRDPTAGDTIWYYNDSANHRFIVQWNCHNKSAADDPWDPDSFEVILYDPVYYPTTTGDGEIVAQYKNTPVDFYDEDLCVGIENPTQTGGLEYMYRDKYGIYRLGDGANPPVAGRAIKWTTDPPQPKEGSHPCLARKNSAIGDAGQSRPNGLLDPGETVEITVELFNSGSIVANGTQAILSTNSPDIIIINGVSNFGNVAPGSTGNNTANPFIVNADSSISYEEVTFKLSITSNGGSYSNEVSFKEIVSTLRTNDPVGPDTYGYYAYDNTDIRYTECPIYEWFEIDPNNGGPGVSFGTNHGFQTKKVGLPFVFKFYGQSYDSVTAASDGYISFTTVTGNNSYENNTPLPYYFADSTMVAGLWDNMDGEYSGPQRWYYYSDTTNHRFIIEYSGVRHYMTPNRETFQIVLYDTTGGTSNAGGPTLTGDGEIVILYKDMPKELDFTTGIENQAKTDGLQYFYNTEYALGASSIKDGQAIKFTTDSPIPCDVIPPERPYVYVEKPNDTDVRIYWHPVTIDTLGNPEVIAGYIIYRNTDPSFVLMNADSIGYTPAPDTVYTDVGVLSDTNSYYYLVKAVDDSDNRSKKSNMGFKFRKSLNENPSATDKNWTSFPYNSEYANASDFTADFSPSGTPCYMIRERNPNQTYTARTYDPFFGWQDEFAIEKGMCYEISVDADTVCRLCGSHAPDYLVSLNENPATTDKNWVSIPYNGMYLDAEDITTEYSPSGIPLYLLRKRNPDQTYTTRTYDPIFGWTGNFTIDRGEGLEFSVDRDTLWQPTVYSNTAKDALALKEKIDVTKEVFRRKQKDAGISLNPYRKREINESSMAFRDIGFSGSKTKDAEFITHSPVKSPAKDIGKEMKSAEGHLLKGYVELEENIDNISFSAYIANRPEEVLTDASMGCGLWIKDNIALWQVECGNFPSPWEAGEKIVVEIEVESNGVKTQSKVKVALDSDVDPQVVGATPVMEGLERPYPTKVMLLPNRPNPFSSNTKIQFGLPKKGMVSLCIYDITGRLIKTLLKGEKEQGYYRMEWNGCDEQGRKVANNIYFYRLTARAKTITRKMILVR